MGCYIPQTKGQQQQMLEAIGMQNASELFADIPQQLRAGELAIPQGENELAVRRRIEGYAKQNTVFETVFLGAGAYRHYIPSIVKQVSSKETFVTAYTPYQAEISQGILQIIFEYQSEICALTGMAVSNASVYDGASAAAEATVMCRQRKRERVLVAENVHPGALGAIQTYSTSAGTPVTVVPSRDGRLDFEALSAQLGDDVSCLYLQSPNFTGLIEDVAAAAEQCHAAGVKLIMGCNPVALALYKTPAELGADIAVGEAQPLGMPLGFGGPYLGFMASTDELMRRLPGRIVGETTDADGKRCFVLTLQAREQHIRREKALSSICSNQALCALTATAYLAAMGPAGLTDVARQCYSKAHYAAAQLEKQGFALRWQGEFFHEFVTECPVQPGLLLEKLAEQGILGGLEYDGGILWCCTEMNTKEEIDRLAAICGEVARV